MRCENNTVGVMAGLIFFLWLWGILFYVAIQGGTGEFKIFLYFVQIIIAIFGPEMDSFFNWLNLFDFNVFAIGIDSCPAKMDAIGKVYLQMFLQLLVVALVLFTMLVHFIGLNIYHQLSDQEMGPLKTFIRHI